MKIRPPQFCALIVSVAFLNAADGVPRPSDSPDRLNPMPVAEGAPLLLASNVTFQRTTDIQATLIHHEATERQRKVAQAHAIAFIKRLPPEKKVAMKKNKTRYIAVDTEKNAQTSPKAKKVVMVWDTQSESLVGNTVYDLPDPPAVGNPIVFTTYAAEYVGGPN